jgi:predicted nuclease of predicted toxin-antitoxin system
MKSTKLKFLVDMGVGKKVEEWLSKNDYDIKAIRDIDPKMKDIDVLRMAVTEKRMVITMDKDFGELVFNSGLNHSGVLLLRLEDANSDKKVKTVQEILKKYEEKLQNNFCVYQNEKIRIRKNI